MQIFLFSLLISFFLFISVKSVHIMYDDQDELDFSLKDDIITVTLVNTTVRNDKLYVYDDLNNAFCFPIYCSIHRKACANLEKRVILNDIYTMVYGVDQDERYIRYLKDNDKELIFKTSHGY
jgi:hypothetical protein